MGKPEFKTSEQIAEQFDQNVLEVADKLAVAENAKRKILIALTEGVSIPDKKDPTQSTIFHIPAGKDGTDSLDLESARNIFTPGTKALREIDRQGGTENFMVWFLKQNGFTTGELMALGNYPMSDKARNDLGKISNLKQQFYDLATSNDPEKLSDFFAEAMKGYKEDFEKQLLQIHDRESFMRNIDTVLMWSGSGNLQQSLVPPHNSGITQEQKNLVNKLDQKLHIFGEDFQTKHMLAIMSPCHTLVGNLQVNIGTPEKAMETFKETGGAEKLEDNLVGAINSFKAIHDFAITEAAADRIMNPVSPKMAVASLNATIGTKSGIRNMGFEGTEYEGVRLSQMRLLNGDLSGMFMGNLQNLGNVDFSNPNDIVGGALVNLDPEKAFFDISAHENQSNINQGLEDGESTLDKIKNWKRGESADISMVDVAFYMSDTNKKYTPQQREQVRAFRKWGDGMLQFDSFDPEIQCVLTSLCHNCYHAEPEEYLSGALDVKMQAKEQYRRTAVDIQKNGKTAVIPEDYTKTAMKNLEKLMEKAPVTIASSTEFKKLNEAYQELKQLTESGSCEGREKEFLKAFTKLNKAADKYINAKTKDGKGRIKRRTTDGQIRMTMARQMKAFTEQSVEGMKVTITALVDKKGIDNVKDRFKADEKVAEEKVLTGKEKVKHNNNLEMRNIVI